MKTNYEVRPIVNALMRRKLGAILIALQIALTLAVVVNSMFVVDSRMTKMAMPVGTDLDNIVNLNVISLDENLNTAQMMREDLRTLRNLPGVEGVISPLNYLQSGSTRYEFLRTTEEKTRHGRLFANVNFSDEHGLKAMGIELLSGRFFRPDEVRFVDDGHTAAPDVVVITNTLAQKLYPEQNPIDKVIYPDDSKPMRIIGVVNDVATGWLARDGNFLADTKYNFILYPYAMYRDGANYLVRAKPGQLQSLIPELEQALLAADPNRVVRNIKTQQEVLANSFSKDYATLAILLAVVALMLTITALGIVGLASYSVKQRTKQIGTRRALGARKRDILRYFMVENLLLTTIGVVIGAVLTFVLNMTLTSQFGGQKLDPLYLLGGIVIVYLLGIAAVYWPANKAASISPAIATRTV